MIFRLTILGHEIFCLTLGDFIVEDSEDDDTEMTIVGGGSTHDFERDPEPLNPDDRYDWEFGFHPPKRVKRGKKRASDPTAAGPVAPPDC